jgi:hypothetical protein
MGDGFLGRWSRRKQEVREGKPVAEPPMPSPSVATSPAQSAAPSPVPSAPGAVSPSVTPPAPSVPAQAAAPIAEAPVPTLEDAQALTPASDFKAFVARGVPPEVRNVAMKKLFADPHFNVMDGLDIYVGDYTQPDPLPPGMLRQMASAHAMGFFDHEKKPAQTHAPSEGEGAIAPANAQPRDDAGAIGAADVAQSEVCNAVPSVSTSEPALADRSAPEQLATPASHTHDDHDAHLRLQPDDAPQRQGAGRGLA